MIDTIYAMPSNRDSYHGFDPSHYPVYDGQSQVPLPGQPQKAQLFAAPSYQAPQGFQTSQPMMSQMYSPMLDPRFQLYEDKGPLMMSLGYAMLSQEKKKRPRRKHDEIERIYQCNWKGCTKGYGTLNHLNAHVATQTHGPKRRPEEFKDIRAKLRERKRKNQELVKIQRQSLPTQVYVNDFQLNDLGLTLPTLSATSPRQQQATAHEVNSIGQGYGHPVPASYQPYLGFQYQQSFSAPQAAAPVDTLDDWKLGYPLYQSSHVGSAVELALPLGLAAPQPAGLYYGEQPQQGGYLGFNSYTLSASAERQ